MNNDLFTRNIHLTDCIFVSLGIHVSLLCLGGVSAIREGTVISALVTGKLTGIFLSHWRPWLQKIAFGRVEKETADIMEQKEGEMQYGKSKA